MVDNRKKKTSFYTPRRSFHLVFVSGYFTVFVAHSFSFNFKSVMNVAALNGWECCRAEKPKHTSGCEKKKSKILFNGHTLYWK